MKENTFLLYWEIKPIDSQYIVSDSKQCQGIPELIHQLRELEKLKAGNVQIFTVIRSELTVITKELLNEIQNENTN
jgi:hypothetical protein